MENHKHLQTLVHLNEDFKENLIDT